MKLTLLLVVAGCLAVVTSLPVTRDDDMDLMDVDKLLEEQDAAFDAEKKPIKEVIRTMFSIVEEVIEPTVEQFEREYAGWLAKDEGTNKLVDLIVKEMLAEKYPGVTKEDVMKKMVEKFMGHLNAEMEVFGKQLKRKMMKDPQIKAYAMFVINSKEASDNAVSNDENEVNKFINVDGIMHSFLYQLGQSSRGLWKGLAIRVFKDMAKDKNTRAMFRILAKQQPGKTMGQVKREFYEGAILGFIHGAIRFNTIFGEKFSKNKKALGVASAIVAGMLKDPDTVKYVVSRGKLLEILERVLDKSVEEFKAGFVTYHENDKDTNAFIEAVVEDLKKNGQEVTVKEVRDAWFGQMDKLLMGSIGQLKGAVADDFYKPSNKVVAMILKALEFANKEEAADNLFKEWYNDEETAVQDAAQSPTAEDLGEFILKALGKDVTVMFKQMGKFYILSAMHNKYTKMYVAEQVAKLKAEKGAGKGVFKKVRNQVMEGLAKGMLHMEIEFKKLFDANFFADKDIPGFLDNLAKGFKGLGYKLPEESEESEGKPAEKPDGKPKEASDEAPEEAHGDEPAEPEPEMAADAEGTDGDAEAFLSQFD